MLAIPEQGKLKQEDSEFDISLGYVARPCLKKWKEGRKKGRKEGKKEGRKKGGRERGRKARREKGRERNKTPCKYNKITK
jgi:hypothetical protein